MRCGLSFSRVIVALLLRGNSRECHPDTTDFEAMTTQSPLSLFAPGTWGDFTLPAIRNSPGPFFKGEIAEKSSETVNDFPTLHTAFAVQ
jgi:hypothetical protein